MKIYPFIGSLAILLLWEVLTATGIVNKVFLPSPLAVASEIVRLFKSGGIYIDLFSTFWRSMLGFVMGASFGIVAGLIMGYYKKVNLSMEFPMDFFRSIPPTALFPLFIIMFGLGDNVKFFIAAWASSMVVLINTIYGIKNVSETRILVAKLKKISWFNTFRYIIFPGALSYLFGGLRIGLSLALVVEIVAEMFLGSSTGLGYRVYNAGTIFRMEEVYATIILIGLLGYLLNRSILIIEKKVVHWAGK